MSQTVNGIVDARATLINAYPGVPILAHVVVTEQAPNTHDTTLYVNGVRVARTVGVASAYAPSTDQAVLGALGPSPADHLARPDRHGEPHARRYGPHRPRVQGSGLGRGLLRRRRPTADMTEYVTSVGGFSVGPANYLEFATP